MQPPRLRERSHGASTPADAWRCALGVLMVAGAAVVLSWYRFKDPDGFYHLKIGQLILEQGALLRTNTLSNLFADYPWSNPEWLFQILLAGAHRLGGWLGVAILKSSLVVALALAVYVTARRQKAGRVASVALTLTLLSVDRSRMTERPHLVSHLFFALTVLLAEEHRRRGGRLAPLALPPLFAVWSNFHPGLIFGLVFLGGVALAEAVAGRWARAKPAGGGGLLLVALACLGASLLNPLGYRVLTYGWEHREYHEALNIAEFTGATPAAHPIFFLLGLLVPLAVLGARKVDAPLLLVTAGFFVSGVAYQRLIPDFAALAVLVVAKALPHLRLRASAWASLLALPAVALAAVLWCWNWDRNGTYRFGHGPLEEFFPAEAADFLDREALPPNLYNNFETGGYLAFRLFPRYRVFQDGRIPAYPRDFMITPHQARSGTSWTTRLDRYDINSAVTAIRLLPNYFPGDQWAVVHWDDSFAVVVRRTRVEPRLLERLEYRYYKPLSPLGPPASAEAARRTEDEIVRNLRGRRARSWRVLLDLAHLKSLTGRTPEAIAHITEAEKILPAGRKPQEMLARAWMFAGRWDLSAAALERAKGSPEQRK